MVSTTTSWEKVSMTSLQQRKRALLLGTYHCLVDLFQLCLNRDPIDHRNKQAKTLWG